MFTKLATLIKLYILGTEDKDPDIRSIRHITTVSLFMALIAFILGVFFWGTKENVVFAFPAFPSMGDCSDTEKECQYNTRLRDAYENLLTQMRTIENPATTLDSSESTSDLFEGINWSQFRSASFMERAGVSVEPLISIMIVIATASSMGLLALLENLSRLHEDGLSHAFSKSLGDFFKRLNPMLDVEEESTFQKASKVPYRRLLLAKIIMNIVFVALGWGAVNILWFVIERVISQPLAYGTITSVVFTSLLAGVFSFFHCSWLKRFSLSNLSLFLSIVLLCGLIICILLTTQIWNVGPTNAYSTMSERAYKQHLAFEVLGEDGSRNVFRLTFIASGLLIVAYSLFLYNELHKLLYKKLVSEDQHWLSKFAKHSYAELKPKWVMWLGIAAGLLVALIGIFPLDSLIEPPIFCFGEKTCSDLLHHVGAYGGPVVILFMILVFWFMAYPKDDSLDKFLPGSSRVWFYIAATSMLALLVSNLFKGLLDFGEANVFQAQALDVTNRLPNLLICLIFIGLLWWMMWFANKKRQAVNRGEPYSPFPDWRNISILGVLLGVLLSENINTVSVEFVILLVFSVFLFSFSKYLDEYIDERFRLEEIQTIASEDKETREERQENINLKPNIVAQTRQSAKNVGIAANLPSAARVSKFNEMRAK